MPTQTVTLAVRTTLFQTAPKNYQVFSTLFVMIGVTNGSKE